MNDTSVDIGSLAKMYLTTNGNDSLAAKREISQLATPLVPPTEKSERKWVGKDGSWHSDERAGGEGEQIRGEGGWTEETTGREGGTARVKQRGG